MIAHVPSLGAKEKHVAPAAELITGGNASHYWEDSGIIGKHYEEVLAIGQYAWDVWMIYKPGAKWHNKLPPAPDYWMHQLGGLDAARQLDSKVFAKEVEKYLQQIGK